jgi:exonuclease III
MGGRDSESMIVCSWNARGLGGRLKKRKVRELITKERVEVMALQESKLEVVNNKLCAQLWGGDDVSWASLPAVGRSGGLITMWDNKKGKLISSFQGHGYLGVVLQWGVNEEVCVIVNVYAPCVLQAKKTLWVELLVARRFNVADHFCILGDFNSVRSPEERKGAVGGLESSEDSRLFNVFIANIGLVDLPLMGRKFTWIRPNGKCMSRLDRVLISDKWWEDCGEVSLWGLKRDVSDHCPLIVKYDGHDWGPKPFRFNNHWLNNKDFPKLVEKEWASFKVEGRKGYALKEKLKMLKGALRKWNKEGIWMC